MNKEFTYRIKIDNEVIEDMLKENQKRALFTYIYLLRDLKGKSMTTINLAELASFLNLPAVSKNIKTIKSSLNYLIDTGLIEAHKDRFKEQKITDMADIKTNNLLYVVAQETQSEAFFTLIDVEVIDKIFYQKSEEKIEDMIALLALLSKQIERRDEVLEVAWYSSDKLTDLLRIKNERYKPLIEEMKRLGVIYFDKAVIGKKEHYIYSMFDKATHVQQAINVAEANKRLDARVKLDTTILDTDVVEKTIDDVGEIIWLPTSYKLERLLDEIGYELNDYSAPLLNKVALEYSRDEIYKILNSIVGDKISKTNYYLNLVSKDNTTGFVVNGLQQLLRA